tara:strand:+ start:12596 stop:13372 length:777 start_codon:yes stop_codon:yes gene_type:complete
MKQMLSFKSFKNINEHVIFDYKEYSNSDDRIQYKFIADNLKYTVDIWHDRSKHEFGLYEVEFGFGEQKHEGDRAGKNLKHLNSVLNTVCEIIERVVKERKIKTIKIEGAGGDTDDRGMFDDNIRTKVYVRFISNRYGSDKVDSVARYIKLDMTKIFPEIFDDKKGNKDLVLDELFRISDASNDTKGIMRGVDGISDDQFSVDTDFIENKKHGGIYFTINVWEEANEFSLSWELLDGDGSGDEYFDDFDSLLKFLKEFN